MNRVRYVGLLAAALATGQALGAKLESPHVDTTGALIELCAVSPDDPVCPAAMGFCLGYLDAALDYHAALTAGPKYDPIACPKGSTTREEMIMVFQTWFESNQHLKGEAPIHGVMRAVAEAWPCSEQ